MIKGSDNTVNMVDEYTRCLDSASDAQFLIVSQLNELMALVIIITEQVAPDVDPEVLMLGSGAKRVLDIQEALERFSK